MIGLDSNVLVRYLVKDDPVQSHQAAEIIRALTVANPAYVTLTAVVETFWVLRRSYGCSGPDAGELISRLVASPEVRPQHPTHLFAALRHVQNGFDLGDCLIASLSAEAGATQTLTFDRRASQLPGMCLVSESLAHQN